MSISGAGSSLTWATGRELHVGENGTGMLSVSGGATLSGMAGATNDNLVLGNASGNGTMLISGPGTLVAFTGSLYDGNDGRGSVTIDAAGATVTGRGFVGVAATGNGTLAVRNGGSLIIVGANGGLDIGEATSSVGVATIDGPGTVLSVAADHIRVAVNGSGTLSVLNGATVTCGWKSSAATFGRSIPISPKCWVRIEC